MKRIIAVILTLVTFLQQTAFSNVIELNVWKDRRSAPVASPGLSLPRPAPLFSDIRTLLNTLPASIGTAKKTSALSLSDKPIVIHIQDVHSLEKAQRNVARLLEIFVEKGGVSLVALEGASEELNLKPLSQFSEATRKQVAEQFLADAHIGGPLYFALTKTPSATFVGVDDSTLFDNNWAVVQQVASSAHALRVILKDRLAQVNADKARVFNPALKKFDDTVQGYRNDTMSVGDYVRFLTNETNDAAPMLRRFEQALNLEEEFSLAKVQEQRDQLIHQILPLLTTVDHNAILLAARDVQAGERSGAEFFQMLIPLVEKSHPRAVPQDLKAYMAYLNLTQKIDPDQLLQDIQVTEQNLYRRLAQSPLEKEFIQKGERLTFAKKLTDFSLTPQEWALYNERLGQKNEIGQFRDAFARFYQLAQQRDEAIAQNLLTAMEKSKGRVVVLVTGGFHSEGIQAALKRNNVDVVSVTPQMDLANAVSGIDSLLTVAHKKWMFTGLFPKGNEFLTAPTYSAGIAHELARVSVVTESLRASAAQVRAAGNAALAPFEEAVLTSAHSPSQQRSLVVVKGKGNLNLLQGRQEKGRVATRSTRFSLLRQVVREERPIAAGQKTRKQWFFEHNKKGLQWIPMLALTAVMVVAQGLAFSTGARIHALYNVYLGPWLGMAKLEEQDTTIRERVERKYGLPAGSANLQKAEAYLMANGFRRDRFWEKMQKSHGHTGVIVRNVYFDSARRDLAWRREGQTYNEDRFQARIRFRESRPDEFDNNPEREVEFMFKTVEGSDSSRKKPGFKVRAKHIPTVLKGEFNPSILIVNKPENRAAAEHNYMTWLDIQSQFDLRPVVSTLYARKAFERPSQMGGKASLRINIDTPIFGKELSAEEQARFYEDGATNLVDPKGHFLTYFDTHIRNQDIAVVEVKHTGGAMPDVVAKFVRILGAKKMGFSKYSDIVTRVQRWKLHVFADQKVDMLDYYQTHPDRLPKRVRMADIPFALQAAFDNFDDSDSSGENISAPANKKFDWYRLAKSGALFLILLSCTAATPMPQAGAGTGFMDFLTNMFTVDIGQLSLRDAASAVMLSGFVGVVVQGTYALFHMRDNYEKEFRIAVLLATPMMGFFGSFLKGWGLMGVPLLSFLFATRSRFGERSRLDMLIFMTTILLGFTSALAEPEFILFVGLPIPVVALAIGKMLDLANAKTFDFELLIEFSAGEKPVAQLEAILSRYAEKYVQKRFDTVEGQEGQERVVVNLTLKSRKWLQPFVAELKKIEGRGRIQVHFTGGLPVANSIVPLAFLSDPSHPGSYLNWTNGMLGLGLFVAAFVILPQIRKILQQQKINRMLALPDGNMDRIKAEWLKTNRHTPPLPWRDRLRLSLKHFFMVVFGGILLVGGLLLHRPAGGPSSAKHYYGKVLAEPGVSVNSPVASGHIVHVGVHEFDEVEKGQVLGYIQSLQEASVEEEKNRITALLEVKQKEMMKELATFRTNMLRSLPETDRMLADLVRIRFDLNARKVDVSANKARLVSAQANLEAAQALSSQSLNSPLQLTSAIALRDEITARIKGDADFIETEEKKLIALEQGLTKGQSEAEGMRVNVVTAYETLFRQYEKQLAAELEALEFRARLVPLIAPISGVVSMEPLVSGQVVPAYTPILTISPKKSSNKIKAWVDTSMSRPAVGDTVLVQVPSQPQPISATVMAVGVNAEVKPPEIGFLSAGGQVLRGRAQGVDVPSFGFPVLIQLSGTALLGGNMQVTISPSNQVRPTAGLQPRQVGQWNGRPVFLEKNNRSTFGAQKLLTQISGAAQIGERLYVVDDEGLLDVLDSGQPPVRLNLKGLETHPDAEGLSAVPGEPVRLALLFERPQKINVMMPPLREADLARNTVLALPPQINHAEGLAFADAQRLYVVQTVDNKSTLFQLDVDLEQGTLAIVRELDLSTKGLGPIRDLVFTKNIDGSETLLLLDATETAPKIRMMSVTAAEIGELSTDQLDLSGLGLEKAEALTLTPDGGIFVGSETKDKLTTNNHAMLRIKPGLYAFWLPLLQRFPSLTPVIAGLGGAVEGMILATALLISKTMGESHLFVFGTLIGWLIVNASIKYWVGFVAFTSEGPIAIKGKSDLRAWLVSNVVAWTSLLALFGILTQAPWSNGTVLLAAAFIHAPLNALIAFWGDSLQRSLRQLKSDAVVLITVRDETLEEDIRALSILKNAVRNNDSLRHLEKNILVTYLGSEAEIPVALQKAAEGSWLFEGPGMDGSVYLMQNIFNLADVHMQDQVGADGLKALVADLANPHGHTAKYVLVSSSPDLFAGLEGRRWLLSSLLGMWKLEPATSISNNFKMLRAVLTNA